MPPLAAPDLFTDGFPVHRSPCSLPAASAMPEATIQVQSTPVQGASSTSDWSRGHAWAIYGYTAVQRYLRSGSACAQQYNAANAGVMDALLAVAVNVTQSYLQMLPTQLQVRCTFHCMGACAPQSSATWLHARSASLCRAAARWQLLTATVNRSETLAGSAMGLLRPVSQSVGPRH